MADQKYQILLREWALHCGNLRSAEYFCTYGASAGAESMHISRDGGGAVQAWRDRQSQQG